MNNLFIIHTYTVTLTHILTRSHSHTHSYIYTHVHTYYCTHTCIYAHTFDALFKLYVLIYDYFMQDYLIVNLHKYEFLSYNELDIC